MLSTKETPETKETKETPETKENSTIIVNTILPNFKFARHGDKEYHVFSGKITDPSLCEGDWLAINSEKLVLVDPSTMEKLKNHKLHWNFDDENTIQSVEIFLDSKKIKT